MTKGPHYWLRLAATNPARIVAYLEALTHSPRVLNDGWRDRYGHDKEVNMDIIGFITASLNNASFPYRDQDLPHVVSTILMTAKDEINSSGSLWQYLVEAGITEAIIHYVLQSPLSKFMTQQQGIVRNVCRSDSLGL